MSAEVKIDLDPFLYDAILVHADLHRRMMSFSVNEVVHRVYFEHTGSFSVGAVGRLCLPNDLHPFAFQIYADQRLRRAPELDDKLQGRWGWRIGERRFAVQLGVLPGRNGAVITRDTEHIELEVPREFISRCERTDCNPVTVLRAFIADACKLSSLFEKPREDGYANNGIEPINLATSYFSRVFETSQMESSSQSRKRRGRKKRVAATDPLIPEAPARVRDRGTDPP